MQLADVSIGSAYGPARLGPQTFGDLMTGLLPNVILFAGVIFFILVIIAGVGVVAGAGKDDAHAQEKAKAFLTYAVIGFIIIFGAFWVLQIINYITKGSLKDLLG